MRAPSPHGLPTDPQALAEYVGREMFALDTAAQAMGMAVTTIGPGHATVEMTVRPDMLNGFGICHGGIVTTLADTAFAYACNSGNELTVASGLNIDFVAPTPGGERLVALAQRSAEAGRTGVYDVTVRTAAGTTVALFRGRSHRIKGRPSVAASAVSEPAEPPR